jgi:hypothetical protein
VGGWRTYNPENGIVADVERRRARGFIKNNPTEQEVVAHLDEHGRRLCRLPLFYLRIAVNGSVFDH